LLLLRSLVGHRLWLRVENRALPLGLLLFLNAGVLLPVGLSEGIRLQLRLPLRLGTQCDRAPRRGLIKHFHGLQEVFRGATTGDSQTLLHLLLSGPHSVELVSVDISLISCFCRMGESRLEVSWNITSLIGRHAGARSPRSASVLPLVRGCKQSLLSSIMLSSKRLIAVVLGCASLCSSFEVQVVLDLASRNVGPFVRGEGGVEHILRNSLGEVLHLSTTVGNTSRLVWPFLKAKGEASRVKRRN
jgi:hypothetical protein